MIKIRSNWDNFTLQFDSLDIISDEGLEILGISSQYVSMPEENTKRVMRMTDVVHEENELNHAIFVINKTGKLKFIEVFDTLYIVVAINSAPEGNSRARCEHRPKLLRKPGKFQEILGSEIHCGLRERLQYKWRAQDILNQMMLTSNATSIGKSMKPFSFPILLVPEPLVR